MLDQPCTPITFMTLIFEQFDDISLMAVQNTMRPGVTGLIEVGLLQPGLLQGEQSPREQGTAKGATQVSLVPRTGWSLRLPSLFLPPWQDHPKLALVVRDYPGRNREPWAALFAAFCADSHTEIDRLAPACMGVPADVS